MEKNRLFMTAKNHIHKLWTRKYYTHLSKRSFLLLHIFFSLFLCLFLEACDSVSTLHIINNSGKDFECECETVNDFSKNTENRRTRYPFLCHNKVVFGSLKSVPEDLIFSVIDPISQFVYIYEVQIPQKKGLRPGMLILQLEHDMSLYNISEDNLPGEYSIPQRIPIQQPEGYPIMPTFQTSKASL